MYAKLGKLRKIELVSNFSSWCKLHSLLHKMNANVNANANNNYEAYHNLIESISSFIERLKVKAQPLEVMIEQAEVLHNDIMNFFAPYNEADKKKSYLWKLINDPLRDFYEMDLGEILSIMIDYGEWPHPVDE